MPNSLTIAFANNPNGIYYPNQVVSGSAELKIVEAIKKARGLRLMVEGEAVCKWVEDSGSANTRRATNYEGEEKYINLVTYLFGSKEGETLEIPVGIHTYNFTCKLPSTVPYSFDGAHGHIRYKVHANVDIPWGFDLQAEKLFTVRRYEDLNGFAELRLPTESEEIKTFCCWFCESDPLIFKVRLPKTGFALGEKIPVSVEMINKSTKDVERTTFSLKRIETYNSQSPVKTKIVKEEMVESSDLGVSKGGTINFEHTIELPHLMISNKRYCNVLQISYELKVTAETTGMNVSPEIHIPLTIGTIGLSN